MLTKSALKSSGLKGSFKSTNDIFKAFEIDGYKVVKEIEYHGMRGFMATSRYATNYESRQPKKTFYVEGNSYQMGYLLGQLDPKAVSKMANEYVYNFIPAMINPQVDPKKFRVLWKLLWKFITEKTKQLNKKYPEDIPEMYTQEIKGLVDGVSDTSDELVTFENLWNLNTAFDLILSNLYTGYGATDLEIYIRKKMPSFHTNMLIPPIFCNGFSVFGNATASKKDHYFGRDFMLSAAEVLQYTATMIIYNSTDTCKGKTPIPFVSVSAPGFVGSLTAMNAAGIGIGVNTVPAANCNRKRPGLNSIMLVRHCAQFASSAREGVEIIRDAQRGVSWLYILADGFSDKAVVVEAGRKEDHIEFLKYIPKKYKKLLPNKEFIKKNQSEPKQCKGIMERWNDYEYPEEYLRFNKKLFTYFKKNYKSSEFSINGFIDNHFKETNCPNTYYFAPIRSPQKEVLVVTNMYIIPEMRCCMMNTYTVKKIKTPKGVKTANNTYDDIQWRYDMLNYLIQKEYGKINSNVAMDILSFLDPEEEFPGYYMKNPTSTDGMTRTIEGTKSVCDLKNKIIKSQFGYFMDEWIQLTLPNYI
ncbi:C45 family peptidase [Aquimarina sediminis]|uniref:carcinine hydrolase/isopenicillin-N N-acyltransferase family protein n=1 Tax=Aquimarina sediminis TaxID=2070536 RepID=UPI000CA000C1|nr:carcinine hydrolase/isopenicillin-N N-acyltransferase family protein [Aquimarina sediminis]